MSTFPGIAEIQRHADRERFALIVIVPATFILMVGILLW